MLTKWICPRVKANDNNENTSEKQESAKKRTKSKRKTKEVKKEENGEKLKIKIHSKFFGEYPEFENKEIDSAIACKSDSSYLFINDAGYTHLVNNGKTVFQGYQPSIVTNHHGKILNYLHPMLFVTYVNDLNAYFFLGRDSMIYIMRADGSPAKRYFLLPGHKIMSLSYSEALCSLMLRMHSGYVCIVNLKRRKMKCFLKDKNLVINCKAHQNQVEEVGLLIFGKRKDLLGYFSCRNSSLYVFSILRRKAILESQISIRFDSIKWPKLVISPNNEYLCLNLHVPNTGQIFKIFEFWDNFKSLELKDSIFVPIFKISPFVRMSESGWRGEKWVLVLSDVFRGRRTYLLTYDEDKEKFDEFGSQKMVYTQDSSCWYFEKFGGAFYSISINHDVKRITIN